MAGNRQDFLRFAMMRLDGLSDVTYRAYILDCPHPVTGKLVTLKILFANAGYGAIYFSHAPGQAAYAVQSDLRNSGYGVVPHTQIEKLLLEYRRWKQIQDRVLRKWPKRDPSHTKALYAQHEAAKARLTARII